jgi:adenosylcobyric acid synthase
VLGVIPYVQGLQLDAEDSLVKNKSQTTNEKIRIAVLALPRISNHNDFDALRFNPEIDFIWVGPEHSIPACDLIINPGSKNVSADLQFLREQGWDIQIAKHLRYGGKLIGVCGGFQMLGETLSDPDAIESALGKVKGLNYFAMNTTLMPEKILRQQQGFLWDKSTPISGYEIHCGVSEGSALNNPALYFSQNGSLTADGALSKDNQIMGTYLHGLFDSRDACKKIMEWVGVDLKELIDINQLRERELNRLAVEVEGAMDLGFFTGE